MPTDDTPSAQELARISEAAQATRLMVAQISSDIAVLAKSHSKTEEELGDLQRRVNQFDVDKALSTSERKATHDLTEQNRKDIQEIKTQIAVLLAQRSTTREWAGVLNTVISTIAAVGGSIAAIYAITKGIHL